MGVFVESGTLSIPYENKYIYAETIGLIIDSKEINGVIQVKRSDLPVGLTEEKLINLLKSKGFNISKQIPSIQGEDNSFISLCFRFKG